MKQKLIDIHGLIHDAAFALERGDVIECKTLLRKADVMAHEAIDKFPKPIAPFKLKTK